MTDPENDQSCPVPDPTIVDPFPPATAARNGQCAPDGFTNNHHQAARSPGQPEAFTSGQEMKITDSVEGEGNFTRLRVWSRFQKGTENEKKDRGEKKLWISMIC